MNRTKHRPVTAGLAKLRNPGVEVRLVDLGQHFFAELGADRLQFSGNGGIFIGQIGMTGLAVNDAQGMTAGGEIEVHRVNHRVVLVQEVNAHQIAHSGSHLIHQAAGLAEKHILCILANLGNFRLGNFSVKEQSVDNGADEDLISGRRTQAGAGQHCGLTVGVKAPDIAAHLVEPGCHTPYQGGRGVDLTLHRRQFRHIHLAHGITLGQNPDNLGSIYPHRSPGIQIHGSGQHPAPLMVRVVTTDLRAAGGRKITFRLTVKCVPESGIQLVFFAGGKNQSRHNVPPEKITPE